MHYRKYRRPTVREALGAVKEELGPSALILSTRMVRARGLSGLMGARVVEVTAAVEREDVSEERLEESNDRLCAPANALNVHARNVAARLEASGMDSTVAQNIARHPSLQMRAVDADAIRSAVADTLAPLTAGGEDFAPVEVFVGPPGVGKTTTIAKIAAQARAAADKRLWLVAADGFRVGAVEQLRLYAEIIGTPLFVARSGAELAATLNGVRRPLLVDTAGRSPRDAGNAEILEVLDGRTDVRRHLVLPADTTPAQARRIIDRFNPSKPDRLVLTRLDETDTLAPLVSVLTDYKLPVSYLAHGQNVPDDLQRATPAALTDWVLGETIGGACA
jgi:flagellar biosynthesis protein FlhF